MSDHLQHGQPRLFLLDRQGKWSRQIHFSGTEIRVGRDEFSDLVLKSQDVSRRHARLWREGTQIYVEDSGSTAGTRVNGTPLKGPYPLSVGDIVSFASARLEVGQAPASSQRQAEAQPSQEGPPPANAARFDLRDQRAESIHMVGGNQYITQVLKERHNILLEVGATKTKARWIILSGFLMALGGAGFFAAGILRFMVTIGDAAETGEMPNSFITPWGNEIFGIPSGLLGWSVAAVGMVLMTIGGILHLVAVGRRKRMERELPLPTHEIRKDTR